MHRHEADSKQVALVELAPSSRLLLFAVQLRDTQVRRGQGVAILSGRKLEFLSGQLKLNWQLPSVLPTQHPDVGAGALLDRHRGWRRMGMSVRGSFCCCFEARSLMWCCRVSVGSRLMAGGSRSRTRRPRRCSALSRRSHTHWRNNPWNENCLTGPDTHLQGHMRQSIFLRESPASVPRDA
jgi:hypothetical protein